VDGVGHGRGVATPMSCCGWNPPEFFHEENEDKDALPATTLLNVQCPRCGEWRLVDLALTDDDDSIEERRPTPSN